MKNQVPAESASALIDEMIRELRDWRGKTLSGRSGINWDKDVTAISLRGT